MESIATGATVIGSAVDARALTLVDAVDPFDEPPAPADAVDPFDELAGDLGSLVCKLYQPPL